MGKRQAVLAGTVVAAIAASLVATTPAGQHALRHAMAPHRYIRFGKTTAIPVVAISEAMPAAADAREPDLRFASIATADVRGVALTAPRLEPSAFAPPTATVKPLPGPAAPPALADAIDRTTTPAPATTTADADLAADLAGARQAMRHYHAGDLAGADEFARLTSGALRTALDWAAIRLDTRDAGPARLAAFDAAHRDWPLRPWVERRIEEAQASQVHDPAAVLALFATSQPATLLGRLGLARALMARGDTAGATVIIDAVWRAPDLTAVEDATIQKDFGSLLHRDDYKARTDLLLYQENVTAAARVAALAGPDVALLARARTAVIAGGNADAAIAAVPRALANDPGLLFARIQKARRTNRIDEAAALMLAAPLEPAALVDGDAWWVERRLVARKLLDAGNPRLAYAIAAVPAAATPAMKIEAAFHAGWIALRFLNDPALAAPHFATVARLAETPISASRGAYWQGRAAEALGHADAAATFYAVAAALPTTFYGQLAALKLGQTPIGLRPSASPVQGQARSEAVRCVAVLFALGERDLAVTLAVATARREPDEAQVAALAEVVAATGDARATLVVGKAGAQRGMPLDEAAFPTFGIPGYHPVRRSADRATVLAIARQESEFDPRSVSSAGAMGLMQLIASTARKTAEEAGIGFDQNRLLTDAAFNAQIGAAHLGKLLNDLDGSYILTFAAYNAGPRKVQEWIAAYGDPRKPGVDAIDWIERIPFTETRNYVQRVFENMQIYRAQFGQPTALLTVAPPGEPGRRS